MMRNFEEKLEMLETIFNNRKTNRFLGEFKIDNTHNIYLFCVPEQWFKKLETKSFEELSVKEIKDMFNEPILSNINLKNKLIPFCNFTLNKLHRVKPITGFPRGWFDEILKENRCIAGLEDYLKAIEELNHKQCEEYCRYLSNLKEIKEHYKNVSLGLEDALSLLAVHGYYLCRETNAIEYQDVTFMGGNLIHTMEQVCSVNPLLTFEEQEPKFINLVYKILKKEGILK